MNCRRRGKLYGQCGLEGEGTNDEERMVLLKPGRRLLAIVVGLTCVAVSRGAVADQYLPPSWNQPGANAQNTRSSAWRQRSGTLPKPQELGDVQPSAAYDPLLWGDEQVYLRQEEKGRWSLQRAGKKVIELPTIGQTWTEPASSPVIDHRGRLFLVVTQAGKSGEGEYRVATLSLSPADSDFKMLKLDGFKLDAPTNLLLTKDGHLIAGRKQDLLQIHLDCIQRTEVQGKEQVCSVQKLLSVPSDMRPTEWSLDPSERYLVGASFGEQRCALEFYDRKHKNHRRLRLRNDTCSRGAPGALAAGQGTLPGRPTVFNVQGTLQIWLPLVQAKALKRFLIFDDITSEDARLFGTAAAVGPTVLPWGRVVFGRNDSELCLAWRRSEGGWALDCKSEIYIDENQGQDVAISASSQLATNGSGLLTLLHREKAVNGNATQQLLQFRYRKKEFRAESQSRKVNGLAQHMNLGADGSIYLYSGTSGSQRILPTPMGDRDVSITSRTKLDQKWVRALGDVLVGKEDMVVLPAGEATVLESESGAEIQRLQVNDGAQLHIRVPGGGASGD